jgi:hypothetical protein
METQSQPTSTESVYWAFIDSFLRITEIRKHVAQCVDYIESPIEKMFAFLEDSASTPRRAFEFYAAAFSLYFTASALLTLSTVGDDQNALESFLTLILGLVVFTLTLTVLYQIFQQVSEVERTFTDYMVIYSLLSGVTTTLGAAGILLQIVWLPLGLLFALIAGIWGLVIYVQLFSRFWSMDWKPVIGYTILGSVIGVIVTGVVIVFLGATLFALF